MASEQVNINNDNSIKRIPLDEEVAAVMLFSINDLSGGEGYTKYAVRSGLVG